MPQARPSWIPPARYKGPDIGDLVFAQNIAPRRHLAILALLDRGDEARPVVRKCAQVRRDRAGVDHIWAMAVRAILGISSFAQIDLCLIAAGLLCGNRHRHLRDSSRREGGEMRRRPLGYSLRHLRAAISS